MKDFLFNLRFLLEGRAMDLGAEILMYQKDMESADPIYRDHDTLIACSRARQSEAANCLARVNRLAKLYLTE